jgi:hypothetical protein
MFDFRAFEAFEGKKPSRLLDQHPDGKHLAMQVETADAFLAAIWETETNHLVWSPEDAHGLAWRNQGTQIAALQNPLLDEAHFLFTVSSWPQGHLRQQLPLRFSMGYLFDLIISPNNDLAVCQWTDQCEFGFEFLALTDHSVTHLAPHRYSNSKTNISTRPVFSPDGRFWVCCSQENISWWADETMLENDEKPSKGGKHQIGTGIVFHRTQQIGEIPLIVTSSAGSLPSDRNSGESLYIADPVFLDTHHFMIRLPSGESQVHDLSKF